MARVIGYIRPLFGEEADYYVSMIVVNFWNNYYIEYESNGKRNKNVSVKEHFTKTKPYLTDLPKSCTWKVQLIVAIDLIFFKDFDEWHVMHSKRANV